MSGIVHRFATTIVVVLSSWSCGSTAPSATPEVAAIVVSPATSTLEPNAQLPLRAQVQDGSGDIVPDAEVTWTVEDPRIVSVSAAGVVKALAVGTSQVAANSLGRSGIAVVTVTPSATTGPASDEPGNADPVDDDPGDESSRDDDQSVASVTVTAPSTELVTGSTMQLSATAKDDNGNAVPDSFVWSSSDTDRATVSESGVVTAKQPGGVTITAQTSSSGGKSGSLRLQIKKK